MTAAFGMPRSAKQLLRCHWHCHALRPADDEQDQGGRRPKAHDRQHGQRIAVGRLVDTAHEKVAENPQPVPIALIIASPSAALGADSHSPASAQTGPRVTDVPTTETHSRTIVGTSPVNGIRARCSAGNQ